MKQYEAVMEVMEKNGGFATFGFLYEHVLKVPNVEWKTKTPFASIRRIVQDERFFFKIKPGLWALKSWKYRLPAEMRIGEKEVVRQELFSHTYYQGLIVQIGKLKNLETFVPAQDKNKIFLGKETLGSLASITKMYPFSYPGIINKAKTIDVVWFNSRRFPASLFEVEHSTNFKDSLIKFVELEDFRTEMSVVADGSRKIQFQETIKLNAFQPIMNCVGFISYEKLSQWHSKIYEAKITEDNIYNYA